MQPDKNIPDPNTPSIPSPSDEAALQAIEALEVETNDLSDIPETPPVQNPTVSAPVSPVINDPVVAQVQPSAPSTPVENPTPAPSVESTTPPEAPLSPVAIALNKSLSETPTSTASSYNSGSFQPFQTQKKSKKPLVIILAVVLVAALAVGGYFVWQSMQPKTVPVQVPQPTTTEPAIEEDITAEADAITSDIETATSAFDSMDDTEYQDSTLSDATLLN